MDRCHDAARRRGERRDRDGYAACHVHGRALRPGGFRKVCGRPREHGVQLLFPRRRGPLRHGRPHHIPTFGGTFEGQGHTISGLDAQGNEVFSHTYHKLDEENENGFLFYQSDDADSGDFTYFAFSPDTMETTYHLEFRYAEDLSDLQSWFEGNYAYWNAAAIAVDYDQETMKNVIELFVTENLTEAE